MANDIKLAEGFEEVPLQEGFEEVPVEMPVAPVAEMAPEESDSALDTLGHGALGVAQGVAMGGADELSAIIRAAAELDPSKYREYQQEAEQVFKEANEKSPWAYNIGELAGGLGTGIVSGGAGLGLAAAKTGAAKAIGKAALAGAGMGAVAGGLGSEGNLSEDKAKLAKDIAAGGALGGVLGSALEAIPQAIGSKSVQGFIEDSPFLRQMQKAYGEGKAGREISGGEKAQEALLKRKSDYTQQGVKEILDPSEKLGKNISNILTAADSKIGPIPLDPNTQAMFDIFKEGVDKGRFNNQLVNSDINPSEFQKLMKNITMPSKAAEARSKLRKLARQFDNKSEQYAEINAVANALTKNLDAAIPEYKMARELFREYRAMGPETIIHKGVPREYRKDLQLRDADEQKNLLYNTMEGMYENMNRGGSGSDEAKFTFNEFIKNLDAYRTKYGNELNKLGINIDPNAVKQTAMDRGDIFALTRRIKSIDPLSGPDAKKIFTVKDTTTSRGLAFGTANEVGKGVKFVQSSAPAKITGKLYNTTEDNLIKIGQALAGNAGSKSLAPQGQALLNAIQTKDQAKKNAVLFAIAQQPTAREIISAIMPDIMEENNVEE